MSVRIAIVDDHQLFREGIRSLLALEPDLEMVAEAACADQAYSVIEETLPDVVLLDYFLPGVTGPTVARQILRRRHATRILMLSMAVDEDRVVQALEAGALGYASKDQSTEELADAIHTVAQGGRYLAPRISRAVLVKNVGTHREAPRAATPLGTLTVREKEIFELAVRGLSNEAIAEHLGISRRTVETHRGRILTKLHMHSAAELARFAARHGLLEG